MKKKIKIVPRVVRRPTAIKMNPILFEPMAVIRLGVMMLITRFISQFKTVAIDKDLSCMISDM